MDIAALKFNKNPLQASKQASSFFNKNLTNADNDNSMNMSTKMEMSEVNKPANNVQTMQYLSPKPSKFVPNLAGFIARQHNGNSVRLSICLPVTFYGNGLRYCHSFFTAR